MSVQDQINRITNEVTSQKDIITQIKETLATKTSGSSDSGGIIDVTELPTENIKENAVYRLTSFFLAEELKIFLYDNSNEDIPLMPILQGLEIADGAIINSYLVDELSNLIPSDMDLKIFHCYVLKSNGIAYLNLPDSGGIIPLGQVFFEEEGYDKGRVDIDDIYYGQIQETGIYTTFSFKEGVKYFIYKDKNWEEISCKKTSGDYIQEKLIIELNEEYFKDSNGEYITYIGPARCAFWAVLAKVILPDSIERIDSLAFTNCPYLGKISLSSELKYIGTGAFSGDNLSVPLVIPSKVETIESAAFSSTNLTEVTFKGKPIAISNDCFYNCNNLTLIRVPWAEGEVEGAPWGASETNIEYEYAGE